MTTSSSVALRGAVPVIPTDIRLSSSFALLDRVNAVITNGQNNDGG